MHNVLRIISSTSCNMKFSFFSPVAEFLESLFENRLKEKRVEDLEENNLLPDDSDATLVLDDEADG